MEPIEKALNIWAIGLNLWVKILTIGGGLSIFLKEGLIIGPTNTYLWVAVGFLSDRFCVVSMYIGYLWQGYQNLFEEYSDNIFSLFFGMALLTSASCI